MRKFFKSHLVSAITIFFFLTSLLLPGSAAAHHPTSWHDGGTEVGDTSVPDAPSSGEPGQAPINSSSSCGDPVYLHSGEFYYECIDLVIPGRGSTGLTTSGLDVEIKHQYHSGFHNNSQFGYGWSINYYQRLQTLSSGNVMRLRGDGRKDEYTSNGDGTYMPPAGFFETLVNEDDGTWTLTKARGEKHLFDINGALSAIEDRNGNRIAFEYDSGGLLPVIGVSPFTKTLTERVVIGYDYRLAKITDTAGREITLTYDSEGRLAVIEDYAGRTVTFDYDPSSDDLLSIRRPSTEQFPDGVTKTFTYNGEHDLETITDAKGQRFVTNHYDGEGRVEQQDLGDGSLFFDYLVADRTTVTDRKGFMTTYRFNEEGNVLSKEEFTSGLRPEDPESYTTTYTYDSNMMRTSVTFPKGNGIKFTYDETSPDPRSQGNLLKIRRKRDMSAEDSDADDIVTTITYEPNFNFIKTIKDPNGNITTYTYDYELPAEDPDYGTAGNLVMIEYPEVDDGVPAVEFSYNTYGQVTKVTDPNGNVTRYVYYPATGYLLLTARDPADIRAVTRFKYDAFGNIDTVTDPNGQTTDYDFDELNWLTKITNPLGYVTNVSYDANGNIKKIERQADESATLFQTTSFTYDNLNNLKTVTDPLSRVTTYNYDLNENLSSIVDAEANTTSYVYDERNRLFTVTDANTPAGVTTYDYDDNGNLRKITDADDNPTTYTYDLFDRLDKTTYADTRFSDFDYDKNSNLTKHTTPGTQMIDYVYDELNRLTDKIFPAAPALDTQYVYDLGSRLTDADNEASEIDVTYDALNRVDDITQTLASGVHTIDYDYDKDSNRTQMVYPSGRTLNYVYDDHDRLTGLTGVLLPSVKLVEYTYDPLDRRIQKSFVLGPRPLAVYGYDLANQLTGVINRLVDLTPVSQYGYPVYDEAGNRKRMNRMFREYPAETVDYVYNDIYELEDVTGAQTHSYTYDNTGNRELADGVSYTPNSLNQYTDVGADAFVYDDNGNLIYDGKNTYTYDAQNRLTSADNAFASAAYEYDGFNRRVSKTIGGVTIYYVYDGAEVIAEHDAPGRLLAEYVMGAGLDEVLLMERDGERYFYHYDGLGSVTEITDAEGRIVENYTYDPYGNITSPFSAIGNPYYFTGRRLDGESGIYYYRNRMYDASIGRFLQRDPLGYWDSMNLYQYVFNSPVNWVDPYGLCGESWWEWWAYESAVPGPYGQPMSEWEDGSPTGWGDPIGYTEEAGGAWQTAERVAVGVAVGATSVAILAGTGVIPNYSIGWKGGEITLTKPGSPTPDMRINPLGDPKSSNPAAQKPHYHRRPGIEKHRPWERGF